MPKAVLLILPLTNKLLYKLYRIYLSSRAPKQICMQLKSKVLSLKIGISRLSSECGNNDFPHAVFFTLQHKLGEITL
jgi:hypothetical protein